MTATETRPPDTPDGVDNICHAVCCDVEQGHPGPTLCGLTDVVAVDAYRIDDACVVCLDIVRTSDFCPGSRDRCRLCER